MATKVIVFDRSLPRSEAFRSLSRWGMLVCLDFLGKRRMQPVKRKGRRDEWEITNNGDIVYPYKEAMHRGINPTQFRDAIDDLIEKGFLDINHQGSGGRAKDMTTYVIDTRWKYYGTTAFKPAKNPRIKNTKQGQGFEMLMNDPVKKKEIMLKRQKTKLKKTQTSVLKTTLKNPDSSV